MRLGRRPGVPGNGKGMRAGECGDDVADLAVFKIEPSSPSLVPQLLLMAVMFFVPLRASP